MADLPRPDPEFVRGPWQASMIRDHPELVNDLLADLASPDCQQIAEMIHAGELARQAEWLQSATVDTDRIERTYARARYWSQCGLPWRVAASRARAETAADPPPVDQHDTFRRRFPEPVTEAEKARARRAAHTAAEALTRALQEHRPSQDVA